ncbi:MAG: fatty acyl-AMP ligase [Pseudomonadota bacterium]
MVVTASPVATQAPVDADLLKEALQPERICPTAEKTLQPFKGSTIAELLRYRASVQPNDVAFANLQGRSPSNLVLNYRQLEQSVLRLAYYLQQQGAQGERIILMYPTGIDYVVALLACIVVGAIAVPVYEVRRSRHVERLRNIWKDATPRFALTTSVALAQADVAELDSLTAESGEWLCSDTLSLSMDSPVLELEADSKPNKLSLLQYTSGSTGFPKGVMVSETALLQNSHTINQWMQPHGQYLVVNWLPPYHDMGLVGGLLQPIYSGFPCLLLSPVSVIQRPKLLLQAISRYRATIAGGPNFIYDICASRIRDKDLTGLDLSSWEIAFNGAEPISHSTLERFSEKFIPYGFSATSHTTCYGLAEATLFVAGDDIGQPPTVVNVNASEFENAKAIEADVSDRAISLVSSGRFAGHCCELKIVDAETSAELADGLIGEIWLRGDALSEGYWRKPNINQETFDRKLKGDSAGGFMRTGDLGFVKNGQLYVAGRIKDLIVIRGRNFHPQDIERSIATCHPEIRLGSTAAVPTIADGIETLTIIQEWNARKHPDLMGEVSKHIRAAVSKDHELTVGDIVFIEPGSLPKTSSGKLQRTEASKLFVAKRADLEHEPTTASPA